MNDFCASDKELKCGPPRGNEEQKRLYAMSEDNIERACSAICGLVKGSDPCSNNRLCRDAFSRSIGPRDIKELRSQIWEKGKVNEKEVTSSEVTTTMRRWNLLRLLRNLRVRDDETQKLKIAYSINGKSVCKSFFKTATGVSDKLFNICVAHILETGANAGTGVFDGGKAPTMKKTYSESAVTAFLDVFFKSKGKRKMVDTCPDAKGEYRMCFTVRQKWSAVYKRYYVPMCRRVDYCPVPYNRFCEIRLAQRPYYIRHRKVKNRKWNHLECRTCTNLEGKIQKAKSHSQEKAELEAELEEHWNFQESFRDAYALTVMKAIDNSDFDMSMGLDASGVDSASYMPYYPQDFTSGEPERHECLRTKNTFANIHGFANIIFQSYPMLEEQGSNLILECIFRSVHTYLEKKNLKSLRNLYIQMDNTNSNKSHTLLAGLSSLVVVGVIRKVKVSYLTVGHSHNDGDGIIGTAGNHMCNECIQTIPLFEKMLIESLEKKGSSNTVMHPIIGISDYSNFLPEISGNPHHISGLSRAHCIRISMGGDGGDRVQVHYKEDYTHDAYTGEAWFPRPAPTVRSSIWDVLFVHPENPGKHGMPLFATDVFPIRDRGKRQCWQYNIKYARGDIQRFVVPCIPIPVDIDKDIVLSRLPMLSRQKMRDGYETNAVEVRTLILIKLRARDDLEFWPTWETFFSSIPESAAVPHSSYYNVLNVLTEKYSGQIPRVKPVQPVTMLKDSSYVDPITWTGGPVSKGERVNILKVVGLYAPIVNRKESKNPTKLGKNMVTTKRKASSKSKKAASTGTEALRNCANQFQATSGKSLVTKALHKKQVSFPEEIARRHKSAESESEYAESTSDEEDCSDADGIHSNSVTTEGHITGDNAIDCSSDEEYQRAALLCHRSPRFAVGDKVRNIYNLGGVVQEVKVDGTYLVQYNDGQEDDNLEESMLRPSLKPVAHKRKQRVWENVVVPAWTDGGAVGDPSKIISGKRTRRAINYRIT